MDTGGQLHAELLLRDATVACAESITGGGVADRLSAAPGASASFVGGVVAYATEVKTRVLGVSEGTLREHGVVSAACAEEMAAGVRALLGSDWAVSTTGVAGPDSQEGKPVGTVFLGVAGPGGVASRELSLSGERAEVRAQACEAAVRLVLERVVGG